MKARLIDSASREAAAYFSAYTLPLGLKAKSTNMPWDETRRGTFSLINAGERKVMVTCYHVWEALERLRSSNADAQLVGYFISALGLVEVFGFRLIDQEKSVLDVAVFVGHEEPLEIPDRKFIDFQGNYCPDVVVGDQVLVVGYPGHGTSITPKIADFGYTHLLLPASAVSPDRIVLADEQGQRVFTHYDDPQCDHMDLGGLSGSPAFVLRDQRYFFAGIVIECSERDQTMMVSRLGCLRPDGTLDPAMLPP